jgi:hypothetical protein
MGVAVLSFTLTLLAPATAKAASLVGTTTTVYGFESATRFYVHCVNDHYWIAFHDGTAPVLFSSRDGVTWTSQGSIFSSFNPLTDQGHWAVRFQGANMIALAFQGGVNTRLYRNGVLNGDGTISWNAPDAVAGPTGSAWDPLNALIANGRPIMWRADADARGRFRRGNQLNGPTWMPTSGDAPGLTPTTHVE